MTPASNRGSILVPNLIALVVLALVWSVALATAADEDVRHSNYEHRPSLVICDVFGDRHCAAALRVAWCESRFDVKARNGQYLGLFQMGSWERRRYGHGSTPRAQARAAHRYFVATKRTWRPWSCKP